MSKTKLTEYEISKAQETRNKIITQQADILLYLIENTQGNTEDIKQTILSHNFPNNRKLKPEAIKKVIAENSQTISPEVFDILNTVLVERNISAVKDRKVEDIGKKGDGITEGRRVKKTPKNNDDQNILKQNKTILQKKGSKNAGKEGEELCEYIGSQIANILLPDDSPKVRLNTSNLPVQSTFIENFQTAKDNPYLYDQYKKKPKNFAKFFAANVLLGDYDIHGENIGIREDKNGDLHLARIDFGRSLSYYVDINWKTGREYLNTPQSAEKFRSRMQQITFNNGEIYPNSMFQGIDFACELNSEVKELDNKIKLARSAIKLTLMNAKKRYGSNFLNNLNINEELRLRLGIPRHIKLTEDFIENRIIHAMESSKTQLQEIANKEVSKLMKLALQNQDTPTIQRLHKEFPSIVNSFMNDPYSKEFITDSMIKAVYNNTLEKKIITVSSSTRPRQVKDQEILRIENIIKGNNSENIATLKNTTIKELSPLKYVIEKNETELAIKMVKAGFTLNTKEIPEKTKETLSKSRSYIEKLFNKVSKNDILRAAIVKDNQDNLDLSNKPSPLHLAIATGQTALAIKMVQQGFTLKPKELQEYAKKNEVKLNLSELLGFYNKKKKQQIAFSAINKNILSKTNSRSASH